MAHTLTPEAGADLAPSAGHTLAAEAGADLVPSAGHTLAAEGGADLVPSAGHTLAAEGGASLGPAAGHTLAAEGGASLAPSAPAQITREPIHEVLRVTGTLTDGTDAVVFPFLPRQEDFTGRPQFYDENGVGLVYWDPPNWEIEHNGDVFSVWRSSENVAEPSLVTTWSPVFPATGAPAVSYGATPDALAAEGGASLGPSAGHTLAAEGGASLAPAAPDQLAAESIY